jgi:hypothetical protein
MADKKGESKMSIEKEEKETRFGGVKITTGSAKKGDPFDELFGRNEERPEAEDGEKKEEESPFQKQLTGILELLENIDGMPAEMLQAMVEPAYGSISEKVKPLLGLLPILTELVGKDLDPLILAALKLSNNSGESEEVKVERKLNRKLKAEERKERYDAYVEAGFTEEQAMTLLLNDITRSPGGLVTQFVSNAALSAVSEASPVAKIAKTKAKEKIPRSGSKK